jgi:hypothetical protein
MAAPRTLKDYLKSLPEWKTASKEFNDASTAVSRLEQALPSTPESSKAGVQAQLDAARKRLAKAKTDLSKVEADAKSYYESNPDEFAQKRTDEATKDLEDAKRTRDALKARGQDTTALDAKIKILEDKIKGGFKETPATGTGTGTGTTDQPAGEVTIESIAADLDTKIADARQFLFDLGVEGRKELAQTLKDAGYDVPIDGSYPNETLLNNYINSLNAVKSQNDLNKDIKGYKPANWNDYISSRVAGAKGTGASATDVGINISSDTDAESLIQSQFKTVLGREATATELASFKKQLNKAEKAAGRKTTKSGNRTIYVSDLNREQFLTNEIKKINVDPKTGKTEFETKRGEKEGLTAQALKSVARLNGITLSDDKINSYVTDIRNGKDVNVIKDSIRQMAGLGRSEKVNKLLAEGNDLDTIYSPYKTTMASLLEVPEDQIDLNDSALQGVFGPTGEMSIYDFRKALKKDSRWQYTNNAREKAYSAVNRILQDFGFRS